MRAWFVAGVLLAAGCVPEPYLVPGSPAAMGSGEVAGVRVTVRADAWLGDPRNLGALMTPLLVTIENRGTQHVRVTFADFSVLGASGFRYPALAPLAGQVPVSEQGPTDEAGAALVGYHPGRPVAAAPHGPHGPPPRGGPPPHGPPPRFYHYRFYVAPPYGYYYYPGYQYWSLTFPYDPWYYDRYRHLWPEPLPTGDMLAEALPEGVVEDGGRVAGFLYFQGAPRESAVRFEMNLVDATDAHSLGRLSLPLLLPHP